MTYAQAMAASSRDLTIRGTVTLPDSTVIHLAPSQIMAYSIDEGATEIPLGAAASASYALEVANANGEWFRGGSIMTNRVLKGAKVEMEIGVFHDGAYDYKPAGVWYVEKGSGKENATRYTLRGGDQLMYMTEALDDSTFTYSGATTLNAILNAVKSVHGLTIYGTLQCNAAAIISKRPDWGAGCSVRNALGFIAAAGGCFIQVARDGKLTLVPVKKTGTARAIATDSYLELENSNETFAFNRIKVMPRGAAADDPYIQSYILSGLGETGKNTIVMADNPLFASGATNLQDMVDALKTALTGYSVDTFSFRHRGDPTYTLGDLVTLTDRRNKSVTMPILQQSLKYGHGMSCMVSSMLALEIAAPSTISRNGTLMSIGFGQGSVDPSVLIAHSITAEQIAAGSITADEIATGAITANEIAAGTITADEIAADSIETTHLKAGAITADKAIIADAAIKTAQIQDAAITNAKIGNAEIATAKIQDAAITNAKIGNAEITTAKIQDASITNAKIGDAEITTAKIADAAITNAKIGNAEIDAAKIADATITTAKIADAAINTAKIDDASITNAKIADAAITNAKIDDAAITTAKIDDASIISAHIQDGAIEDAHIGTAGIGYAHIKDLLAGTAIIRDGIGGKLIIDRLAVSEANIVNLTAGQLIVQGTSGALYQLTVDSNGDVITELRQIGNSDIADVSLNAGEKLVKSSITADLLNVQEIFASQALIGAIKAQNIETHSIGVNQLTTGLLENMISNSSGQQMVVEFTYGAILDRHRTSTIARVRVFHLGVEITARMPANAITWQRISEDKVGDRAWNALPAHQNTKTVTINAADVNFRGVLRCKVDESRLFSVPSMTDNGELVMTDYGDGDALLFTITAGDLIYTGTTNYEIRYGELWTDMLIGTFFLDTQLSNLKTSYVDISRNGIEMYSDGYLNLISGSKFNMRAGAGAKAIGLSNDHYAEFFAWAGAANPALAPFYVKMDGTVRATSLQLNNSNITDFTQMYPYSDSENASPAFPMTFRIFIPSECSGVESLKLTFACEPFRAYSTGAASGGGATSSNGGATTLASSSGGSSTQTSTSGGASTQTSTSGGSSTQTSTSGGNSATTSRSGGGSTSGGIGTMQTGNSGSSLMTDGQTSTNPSHQHYIGIHNHLLTNHTHTISSHTHVTDIPAHTHDVSIPAHTHDVSIPGHTHKVTIPAHTHSVSIPAHAHTVPDHTHDIVYGIYEGTTASSVFVMVDGNNYGSFASLTARDVTSYLSRTSGKITRDAWHLITLTPNRLTRIVAQAFVVAVVGRANNAIY